MNAVQTLHVSERDISIRRASFFNELYEATVVKEAAESAGSAPTPPPPAPAASSSEPASSSAPSTTPTDTRKGKQEKGKGKKTSKAELWREEAERAYMVSKDSAGHKWTWGVDLTEVDLDDMVRGQYRGFALPHSRYDATLPLGGLRKDSAGRTKQDMVDLEKEIENPPVYEALSADIRVERNLDPEEIPLVFSQFPIFLEADAAADAVLCAGFWLPRPPADYVQPPELHCSLPPGA